MQTRLMVEDPKKVVFTMKITMAAEEWEQLRDQLGGAWPGSELIYQINSLLVQARKVFYPKEAEND